MAGTVTDRCSDDSARGALASLGDVFPCGGQSPHGLEAWKQVIERGYEGYVAKDEASAYEGGATRRWLKVKQKAWMVGGWHLVVESDDEKIRNLLLGLTGLLI